MYVPDPLFPLSLPRFLLARILAPFLVIIIGQNHAKARARWNRESRGGKGIKEIVPENVTKRRLLVSGSSDR